MGSGTVTPVELFQSSTNVKDSKNEKGESESNSEVPRIEGKWPVANSSQFQIKKKSTLIQLKVMLKWLGYEHADASKTLDASILACLQDFQRDYNLPAKDHIDDLTIQQIKKEFTASINNLETRLESIKYLKQDLNKLGFGKILVSNKIGSFTLRKIKDFQVYYRLPVTGFINVETLMKIDEILLNPLQEGKQHDDLILLKKYLNLLGYGYIKITKKFGKKTERAIRKFQKENRIPVNGMVDEITKLKIYNAVCSAIKPNKRSESIKYIKEALNRLGFGGIEISSKLGPFAVSRLTKFQTFYGLPATGKANVDTLLKVEEILSSPLQIDKSHKDVLVLKNKLIYLGYGAIIKTDKFGELTEKKVKQFQRDHDLPVSGIADKLTMQKLEQACRYIEKKTFNYFDMTLEEALKFQIQQKLHKSIKQRDINSILSELEPVFNPERLIKNEKDKFQLLDLSRSKVVTIETLHKFLKKSGIFVGLEEVFINAASEHRINEIVLASHALLEVERGFSLINGVPVDKNGRITYVEEEKNNLKSPGETSDTYKWVYNVYGISNEDNLSGNAKIAFDEGWDTVEKAIIGGAKYIKEMYLGDGRNTFYNMRWDLPTEKEVNSDTRIIKNKQWLFEQLDRIHSIYKQLDSYVLYLDIPIYKK